MPPFYQREVVDDLKKNNFAMSCSGTVTGQTIWMVLAQKKEFPWFSGMSLKTACFWKE
jgi:hypothetical protein